MLYVVLYNIRRMGLLWPSPCRMPWLEIGSHYYRQALIQVVFSPPQTHVRTLPYNRHWHHWKVCLAKSNHLFRVIYNIVKHRLHVWCGHRPGPAATPHWPPYYSLAPELQCFTLHRRFWLYGTQYTAVLTRYWCYKSIFKIQAKIGKMAKPCKKRKE